MDELKLIKFPRSVTAKDGPVLPPESVTPPPGPVEKRMRAVLSSLKGSRYLDTFDWGIYDRIAGRFGNKPPRGGVVFNTTLCSNVIWSMGCFSAAAKRFANANVIFVPVVPVVQICDVRCYTKGDPISAVRLVM